MGRRVWAAVIVGLLGLGLAAGPLRTTLSGRHIFYGQPVTLTVRVAPAPVWRELTVSWYDAAGFLVSQSSRTLDEGEGGQHFYKIRTAGDPGLWHVYTLLTGPGSHVYGRVEDSFDVLAP